MQDQASGVCDQVLSKGNAALLVSCATGKPVRVVRGSNCCWRGAPVKGYRYDGLYKVTEVWEMTGTGGFGVYSFKLERLPMQTAIVT